MHATPAQANHVLAIVSKVFSLAEMWGLRTDIWTLPMPARFVVGRDGIIRYAEVSPDYTRRPDPSKLLPVRDGLSAREA